LIGVAFLEADAFTAVAFFSAGAAAVFFVTTEEDLLVLAVFFSQDSFLFTIGVFLDRK
jgi:hypothetical protein